MAELVITYTDVTTGAKVTSDLHAALKNYAGLGAVKPGAVEVQRTLQLLQALKWAGDAKAAPCVIAAWLGGAPDQAALTNWSSIISMTAGEVLTAKQQAKGSAQAVCGVESDWAGDVHPVTWYLDGLALAAPAAAALIEAAGNATAKKAKESVKAQEKQDVEAVKQKALDTAKEAAGAVAGAATSALGFAGFGAGAVLALAVIAAIIIYAPKKA